tara:strand:- start:962 stop:1216 length:255 start_codon:yes stop_codon:yes gene_type:complete
MSDKLETFSFEDGVEHRLDDISDEGKLIFQKLSVINKAMRDVRANTDFELEKLSILSSHYANKLKEIVSQEKEVKQNEPESNKK